MRYSALSFVAVAVLACASAANAALVSATLTANVDGTVGGAAGGVTFLQDETSSDELDKSYDSPASSPDYIATGTPVVFSYDFGGTKTVDGFLTGDFFGGTNENLVTEYTIDLGTTAGADDIASNIVVSHVFSTRGLQAHSLGGSFNAAFATATITDNGYVVGGLDGGDRVATSEASFSVVPEPSAFCLATLSLLGLAAVRRRSRRS